MVTGDADELLSLFLDEAGERLERLRGLAEEAWADADGARRRALQRELHALKGASRMLGLTELARLCHETEDLVGDAGAPPDAGALAAAWTGIERLIVRAASAGESSPGSVAPPPGDASGEVAAPGRDELRVRASLIDELADRGARLRVIAAAARSLAGRVGSLAELAGRGAAEPEPRQVLATLAISLRQAALELEGGQRAFERLADQQLDRLLRLQVQPLRPFMQSLAAHARELAASLGKRVEVSLSSGEAQLDRRIVNALREAFLHLVRNAVDHGLEAPSERSAAGKPEHGSILISALTEGDRVRLQVADDGRGIDARAVVATAVARGLLDPERADELEPDEVLHLLLQPGFTTRERSSEVSGRGIGLDAVATAVRAVGGDLWLESSVGGGTAVTVEVPVARRGDRVLVLQVGGQVVALPAAPVQAFHSLPAAAIAEVDGRFLVRLRGRSVEPRFLAELDGRSPAGGGVLLEMFVGGAAVAVVADQVVGEEEVVVRPMPRAAGAPRGVEGMALLASGRPVAVLSLQSLAPSAELTGGAPGSEGRAPRTIEVLLVDDSEVTRELFRRLLEGSGYAVSCAGGGDEALAVLAERRFDCVVTDIEMPGTNGLELTRAIRGDPRLADLPVIVVSTLDRPLHRMAGLEAGADAYLSKSGLDARELVALVARVGGHG
ncbi:MAG: response regulator [Thermoanaerobaculales bacterium]|nr:response regulator [Thermoanaerobaculales bacterium]